MDQESQDRGSRVASPSYASISLPIRLRSAYTARSGRNEAWLKRSCESNQAVPATPSSARRAEVVVRLIPIKLLGSAAVVLDEHGRVLLVKHSDGRLNRELPGGRAEEGES